MGRMHVPDPSEKMGQDIKTGALTPRQVPRHWAPPPGTTRSAPPLAGGRQAQPAAWRSQSARERGRGPGATSGLGSRRVGPAQAPAWRAGEPKTHSARPIINTLRHGGAGWAGSLDTLCRPAGPVPVRWTCGRCLAGP